jgi:ABC-type polysaccharide/polyol phosphate transport system ATPase subunit
MKLIRQMCNIIVHLDHGEATLYKNVKKGIAAYRKAGGKS